MKIKEIGCILVLVAQEHAKLWILGPSTTQKEWVISTLDRSDQLHALVILPLGREILVGSGYGGDEKNLTTYQESGHNPVTIPTKLSPVCIF
jgi:hypothetical protein